ncbi:MAG: hypothetical protein FJX76_29320 [Armatimonadetes bacterium]|nr:hypothetical protein [Armatimonadota bacterium]
MKETCHGTLPGGTAGRRGLALIEVLLGLALVTVGILVLFLLFPAADQAVALSDRTAQATQLARRLMERQMALSFDDAKSESDSETVEHTTRRNARLSTQFTWQVEVTQPESGRKLKRIVVTVSWEHGKVQRSVRCETCKGAYW